MYTQQNIREIILNLEQKYPVDTWIVNGIYIWPYIRIKLYIHMLILMNNKSFKIKNNIKNSKKNNNTIIRVFKKAVLVFKAQFSLLLFFSRLNQKKIIFFGSHFHRIFHNGMFFNRFYDTMVEYHNLQDDIYTVEYQRIDNPIYNEKSVIPLNKYLNYYKTLKKFSDKFKKKKTELNLKDFSLFYEDLSNYNLKLDLLKISETEIIKWSHKVNISQAFFKKMYKYVKPSKVIFLGYYGYDDLYAALISANSLNIKTIDFQHGPQTNVHMAFSSWNKVPESGYNTMPVEFWHWDKVSKDSIDAWAGKTKVIKSKVVGQPYLAYWMSNRSNKTQKNTIIYSLQTTPFSIEALLTKKIVTLIKRSKLHWILRLHPRNNLNLNELDDFLRRNQIKEKISIQDAFNKPLPEVLTSALLHITNYSGCLIEAYQLGVPTLLINEVGKEMFSQYLESDLVSYLEQKDDDFVMKIELLIEKLRNKKFSSSYKEVFNPLF